MSGAAELAKYGPRNATCPAQLSVPQPARAIHSRYVSDDDHRISNSIPCCDDHT
jgi:hypothetical protein